MLDVIQEAVIYAVSNGMHYTDLTVFLHIFATVMMSITQKGTLTETRFGQRHLIHQCTNKHTCTCTCMLMYTACLCLNLVSVHAKNYLLVSCTCMCR